MLAIALSCLFGLAAFAALVVIRSSLGTGAARVRIILGELAAIERQPRVTRTPRARPQSRPGVRPAFAAA